MDKRFFACAALIVIFAALFFWAYKNLEIYAGKTPVPPSQEVRADNYLALKRWLAETGRPVRVESRGSAAAIAAAPERAALVEASACDWENAGELLRPWIEGGGFLAVSVAEDFEDEALADFFADLGIEPDDGKESLPFARLSLGEGGFALISRPRFMFNNNLREEGNARLAWELIGTRAGGENHGVLFIMEKRVNRSLFGRIAGRGNVVPLAISVLIVLMTGFWMVIPVFGRISGEKRVTARPIRERFLAETRFFKKYGALNYYLEMYERELRITGSEKPKNYRGIISRLKELQQRTERV